MSKQTCTCKRCATWLTASSSARMLWPDLLVLSCLCSSRHRGGVISGPVAVRLHQRSPGVSAPPHSLAVTCWCRFKSGCAPRLTGCSPALARPRWCCQTPSSAETWTRSCSTWVWPSLGGSMGTSRHMGTTSAPAPAMAGLNTGERSHLCSPVCAHAWNGRVNQYCTCSERGIGFAHAQKERWDTCPAPVYA